MAECGNEGSLGSRRTAARKDGRCRIRGPQGSHLKNISILGNLSEEMEGMTTLTSAPTYVAQGGQDSSPNILPREPCDWGSYATPLAFLECCCCYGGRKCADVLQACGLRGKRMGAFEQN